METRTLIEFLRIGLNGTFSMGAFQWLRLIICKNDEDCLSKEKKKEWLLSLLKEEFNAYDIRESEGKLVATINGIRLIGLRSPQIYYANNKEIKMLFKRIIIGYEESIDLNTEAYDATRISKIHG